MIFPVHELNCTPIIPWHQTDFPLRPDGTARKGHRQLRGGFARDHGTSRGATSGVGGNCGSAWYVLGRENGGLGIAIVVAR